MLWSLWISMDSRLPLQACSNTAVRYRYHRPYNVQTMLLIIIISFMFPCKMTVSLSGVDGNSSLLGCDEHFVPEVSTIHFALIFKDNNSVQNDFLEEGGDMNRRNFGNDVPSDRAGVTSRKTRILTFSYCAYFVWCAYIDRCVGNVMSLLCP